MFLTQYFHFLFSLLFSSSQINKHSRATSSSSESMIEKNDDFYIVNFSSGNVSHLFPVKLSLVIAIFYRKISLVIVKYRQLGTVLYSFFVNLHNLDKNTQKCNPPFASSNLPYAYQDFLVYSGPKNTFIVMPKPLSHSTYILKIKNY